MGLFAKLFGKKKADKNKTLTASTEAEKKVEIKSSRETPASLKKEAPAAKKTESAPQKKNSTPQKKPQAPKVASGTSVKAPPQKSTSAQASSKTDEEAAEKISVDKASETVKVKGLSGFFDIKKSKDGRYVFNLYASNRVIIATSQIYSSASSALNGANSVIANAARANIEDQTIPDYEVKNYPKWEIYKDKIGQFRFRLSASNGSCICHSQGYTAKASCKNGIESIIRTVGDAKIDKNYLK